MRPGSGKVLSVVGGKAQVSARRSTLWADLKPPLRGADLPIGGEVGLEWFKDRPYVVSVVARSAAAPQDLTAPSGLRAQAGVLRWDWTDPNAHLAGYEIDCAVNLPNSAAPYPLEAGNRQFHQPLLAGWYYYRVRALGTEGGLSAWTAWAGPYQSAGGFIVSGESANSGSTKPHQILSPEHSDTAASDVPELHDLLHWNGALWDAVGFRYLLELLGYIGREEGPRIGFRVVDNNDGTRTLAFEAIPSPNVSVLGFSTKDYLTNSTRLILGNPNSPKRIELEAPTAWDTDPDTTAEEVRGMTVPLQCLAELITAGYIDLADLAEHFYLAHDTSMPDALNYPAGNLRLMQSPGDPNLFILWVRDHLDQWQLIGGAGYMAPHTHTSEETGGVITASGGATLEPLCCDSAILFCGGDALTIGVTI